MSVCPSVQILLFIVSYKLGGGGGGGGGHGETELTASVLKQDIIKNNPYPTPNKLLNSQKVVFLLMIFIFLNKHFCVWFDLLDRFECVLAATFLV